MPAVMPVALSRRGWVANEVSAGGERMRWYMMPAVLVAMVLVSIANAAAPQADEFIGNIEQGRTGSTLEKGNVVVVPIPMSNPTLGSGLQLAGLYLHPSRGDGKGPNPTTGIGGIYTDSDSWVAGIFHQDYLFEDRLRVSAVAGAGSLKLEYYGFGGEGAFADRPLDYTLDMSIGYFRALWRLPGTEHWFAGPALLYSQGRVEMNFPQFEPVLPAVGKDIAMGAGGLVLSYDSRDNNYYPRRGANFSASWFDFSDTFGSDFDYGKTRLSYSQYWSVSEKLVLAVNGESERGSGAVPFFSQSAVTVRGYNRGRYMDDVAMTVHLEGRYKFHPRWMWLGFYDHGWLSEAAAELLSGESAHSTGTGLHWQTTRDKPLHLGLDVAFTADNDTVFFIQLGERF